MAYTFAENQSGLLQIANIDTGVTSPSGVSTGSSAVIPHGGQQLHQGGFFQLF